MAKNKRTDSESSSTRIIRVRDLPVYYDRKKDDIARHLPKLPEEERRHWIRPYISEKRHSIEHTWKEQKEMRARIVQAFSTAKARTQRTFDAIREDHSLFPKVALITVSALGGLLFGQRTSLIRKTVYSSVATALAFTVCYPKQSAQTLDQIYLRIEREWKK